MPLGFKIPRQARRTCPVGPERFHRPDLADSAVDIRQSRGLQEVVPTLSRMVSAAMCAAKARVDTASRWSRDELDTRRLNRDHG